MPACAGQRASAQAIELGKFSQDRLLLDASWRRPARACACAAGHLGWKGSVLGGVLAKWKRVSGSQLRQVPYREDGPPLAYLFDPIPLPPGAKRKRASGAKRPRSDSRARSAVRLCAAQRAAARRAPCRVWEQGCTSQGSLPQSSRAGKVSL